MNKISLAIHARWAFSIWDRSALPTTLAGAPNRTSGAGGRVVLLPNSSCLPVARRPSVTKRRLSAALSGGPLQNYAAPPQAGGGAAAAAAHPHCVGPARNVRLQSTETEVPLLPPAFLPPALGSGRGLE